MERYGEWAAEIEAGGEWAAEIEAGDQCFIADRATLIFFHVENAFERNENSWEAFITHPVSEPA